MDNFGFKDSGQREQFGSGAVRDDREGKGRYDLFSPFALHRVALVFEKGARKYDPRNWEKGMPIGRTLDSAIRHIVQFMMGKKDEDHIAHAAWNLLAVLHFTSLERSDLNDLPNYNRDEPEHEAHRQTDGDEPPLFVGS